MGAPIGNKNAAGPRGHSSFKNVGNKLKSRASFRRVGALSAQRSRNLKKSLVSHDYIKGLAYIKKRKW